MTNPNIPEEILQKLNEKFQEKNKSFKKNRC
jgi:hypothetical protein